MYRSILFLLTCAACSESPNPQNRGGPDPQEGGEALDSQVGGGDEAKAPLAEVVDQLPWPSQVHGALHGTVRVKRSVPDRFPIGARKMADCTHHEDVDHLSDVFVVTDGKLKYAFLALEPDLKGLEIPAAPEEPVVLDQRGCIYTPHVQALQIGQEVVITNSDPATHNVHVTAKRNRSINVTQAVGQAPLHYEPKRADTVRFQCDLHPWMFALVHVCDHPWFAVTDDHGSFLIKGIVPGEYTIKVEHEELGILRRRVVIEAGMSTGIELAFE